MSEKTPKISQEEIRELVEAVADTFLELEDKNLHVNSVHYGKAVRLVNIVLYKMTIEATENLEAS